MLTVALRFNLDYDLFQRLPIRFLKSFDQAVDTSTRKAIGVMLEDRVNIAQVSINRWSTWNNSHCIVVAVSKRNAMVFASSEQNSLDRLPASALIDSAEYHLQLEDFGLQSKQVLKITLG